MLNVALTAFIIGRVPSRYYVYWTIKSVLLFTWRFFSYRRKSLQWLMLELCYFGNFVGLIHVWFFPESIAQRRLAFAFASGPLMFSIAAMRNSLVFHDVDKSTTLMMHASPAMAAWTLRWYDTVNVSMAPIGVRTDAFCELVAKPVAVYIVWVVAYYLIVFKLRQRPNPQRRAGSPCSTSWYPRIPRKIKKSPVSSRSSPRSRPRGSPSSTWRSTAPPPRLSVPPRRRLLELLRGAHGAADGAARR